MKVAADILKTVESEAKVLGAIPDAEFSRKLSPVTWSAKEIIGHLVDSAQNNLQRFVRGQYEKMPRIIYAQDEWVKFQAYQQADKQELIQLWVLLNRQLCRTLLAMDPAHYNNETDWGKSSPDVHTLAFVAEDYHRHMIHHLDQLKQRLKIPN